MEVSIANQILSLLTILSQIISIVLVITFLFPKRTKKIRQYFKKRAIYLAFLVSLTATFGSLYYSEIARFVPCTLCWYQRIFMYPQTFLFLTSIYKKTNDIYKYSLVLSFVGGIIALYHYLSQIGVTSTSGCPVIGYSVSCSQKFVLQYGYITIPMMAFSAFLLIFLLMLTLKRK